MFCLELDTAQIAMLANQYAASYEGSVFGPHYVIPVRGGRLTSEIEIEGQFLETVRAICEVVNGEIVLKDGSHDVQVIRTHVDGSQ